MSTYTEANPPAFPRSYRADGHNGMTLRDWFAGQAPQVPDSFTHVGHPTDWIADSEWTQDKQDALNAKTNVWLAQRAVAWSVAYADAMLAERAKVSS